MYNARSVLLRSIIDDLSRSEIYSDPFRYFNAGFKAGGLEGRKSHFSLFTLACRSASKNHIWPCISPEMPISPPITIHTSNPVYIIWKVSFFQSKIGQFGQIQASRTKLKKEEGDFLEHVDWIWSVYCDWGTNWHLWWIARLNLIFRRTLV